MSEQLKRGKVTYKGGTLTFPKRTSGKPELEAKKKVHLAVYPGGPPVYVKRTEKDGPTILLALLHMVSYEIKNGSLHWTMRTADGVEFSGGIGLTRVPGTYIKVTPKVPVTLHKRYSGLAMDFIFVVDRRDTVNLWKTRGGRE